MDKQEVEALRNQANADRSAESLAGLAMLVGRYRRQLYHEGFDRQEAFYLASDFQARFLDDAFEREREANGNG